MRLLLALLALLPLVAGCATPSQMAVDAEVKRLCAIDGGIKVYETVKLPADKFNQWGQTQDIRNASRTRRRTNMMVRGRMEFFLGTKYTLKRETKYYRQAIQICSACYPRFRRLDGKLLGESGVRQTWAW
ncbi:MAG: hypothetical protein IPJ52_00920 [Rhodocyclaceae bacterium]|nr:hypothetical protein [Rhodocyclaceae bacterium]